MRDLTIDKYFWGGQNQNKTKLTKPWCTLLHQNWYFLYNSAQLHGCWVWWFILFYLNQILMQKRSPQDWYFFHLFFFVYQYPFVQCRLEPVMNAGSRLSPGTDIITLSLNFPSFCGIGGSTVGNCAIFFHYHYFFRHQRYTYRCNFYYP